MQRKKWTIPQLVVLVRGKPDEAILTACKGLNKTGPYSFQNSPCCATGSCNTCNPYLDS